MQKYATKLLVAFTINIVLVSATENCDGYLPIAKTKYGEIRGAILKSRKSKPFAAYRGIPYAQPPIGPLRFKAPQDMNKWKGIRNATEDAPTCIQQDFLFKKNPQIEGSEDCLYLNVYSPKVPCQAKKNSRLLPVIFFIHYGAFMAGNSRSDIIGPEYIVDNDVILVTFNYRLGVMGFLSTYDDEAPGNWAFKDQITALRWVQNNIHYFGGSNKKITIAGQSAGAGSVHHLLLSPITKGLFQSAITMSGSALALWAVPMTREYFVATSLTALAVGCNYTDNKDLVNCLRGVPAYDLVNAANVFRPFIKSDPLTPYFPAIEEKTNRNPEPFITEQPLDIIKKGKFHNVPWMIGTVSEEGILRAAPFVRQEDVRAKIDSDFDKIEGLVGIGLSVPPTSVNSLWSDTKSFYFDEIDNLENASSITGLINLYSDRAFIYPTYQSIKLHKLMGHNHIFVYNFNYKGKYTYGDLFAGTEDNDLEYKWGVSHCDDLLYIFNSPGRFPNYELPSTDLEVSRIMLNFFINFVKYGDPTPEQMCRHQQRWEELPDRNSFLSEEELQFLDISGSYEENLYRLNMTNGYYTSRMRFWESKTIKENVGFSRATS